MQQAFVDRGFPMPVTMRAGLPDGIYGNETVKTVFQFQSQNGLQRDGQAGHDTLHKLDSLFPSTILNQILIEGAPFPGLPPLTERSILTCPHAGFVQAFQSSGPRLPENQPRILTVNDVFLVQGCTFLGPDAIGVISPCVRVEWFVSNALFRVNNANTLNRLSQGLCLNGNGLAQGPVNILSE